MMSFKKTLGVSQTEFAGQWWLPPPLSKEVDDVFISCFEETFLCVCLKEREMIAVMWCVGVCGETGGF